VGSCGVFFSSSFISRVFTFYLSQSLIQNNRDYTTTAGVNGEYSTDDGKCGLRCYGDHCSFGDNFQDIVEAIDYVRETNKHRSRKIVNRLPFKTILFARAEYKLLGSQMDEKIPPIIWDRIRSAKIHPENMFTYFVRRHLNSVAMKCRERYIPENPTEQEVTAAYAQDLNPIYRELVYSDALSRTHPARFYYDVPVCANCYKIYSFMDTQRYEQVLCTDRDETDIAPNTSRANSTTLHNTTKHNHRSRVRESSEGHDHKQSVFDQETKHIDESNNKQIRNLAKSVRCYADGDADGRIITQSTVTTARPGRRRHCTYMPCPHYVLESF
jgi:hypothetical protein